MTIVDLVIPDPGPNNSRAGSMFRDPFLTLSPAIVAAKTCYRRLVIGMPTTLEPLRHRDFRRLWTGTFFATGAQWIQQATLGWVVYDVTHSPTLLGAVLGVRAIPMLLLAPLSGFVADRFD